MFELGLLLEQTVEGILSLNRMSGEDVPALSGCGDLEVRKWVVVVVTHDLHYFVTLLLNSRLQDLLKI